MDTIELNDVNFDSEVKKSTMPVLVDFYATWCGPCKKQIPIMDEIAKDYNGKARVGKLNVDEAHSIAAEFGISSIPALLVFNNGQITDRMIGLHSKSQLTEILNKYI